MTSKPPRPPTAQVLAEAAARRHPGTEAGTSDAQFMQEHDKRQMFRRLIDPGIFRPNSKETAMDSLKASGGIVVPRIALLIFYTPQTLSTIAENILREPENPRYHTFKHENDTIKRRLIQPKGALEYALAVMGFQSYYVFNPRKMADLRIGAVILREAVDRETEKEERLQRNREEQEAAAAVIARNVKLAFLDDRKNKMMYDERDRALREAREAARESQSTSAALASPDQSSSPMPGLGHTLTDCDPGVDQPPPYPYHD
ncbi:hypothetical protein J3R83DRAFT_1130 [Lanmaoa asiatica]|nr:hypothetical protein J3R83DRAFT_1130 [Lanmaoa asiatica]